MKKEGCVKKRKKNERDEKITQVKQCKMKKKICVRGNVFFFVIDE
jgi:hypothetical protein